MTALPLSAKELSAYAGFPAAAHFGERLSPALRIAGPLPCSRSGQPVRFGAFAAGWSTPFDLMGVSTLTALKAKVFLKGRAARIIQKADYYGLL